MMKILLSLLINKQIQVYCSQVKAVLVYRN